MTVPASFRRRVAGCLVCLTVMTGIAAGCSDGDDETAATTTTADSGQAYCDAWADLIAAFEAYDQIDVVNGGLDSVRTYFDDLDVAAQTLETAVSEQLGDEVDAFTTALDDLGTTLTSPSLPVDRREQVRAAAAEVDTAWNDLVAAFKADCPSVTASTVDASAA